MKSIITIALLLTSLQSYAEQSQDQLLKEFHKFGITHCDEFVTKNTKAIGTWKFFMHKHAGGIDGPSTEVALTQISGKPGQSFKTDYSFIQTLKKCFVHKRGHITAFDSCDKAVDTKNWKVQYNLPGYDYKRYKDKNGVILYAKDITVGNEKACLLDYEFRSSGKHSIYRP